MDKTCMVPLFLFLKNLSQERMKSQMKQEKILWSSISILIGAVIVILALVRGSWQSGLLIIVFTLWGLWIITVLLLPYMHQAKCRQRQKQQIKRRQQERISPTVPLQTPLISREPIESLLLHHVNHRISSYLQSAYPDVTWEWCEKKPEQLVIHGGVGRIRVFGAADFDHADITLDENANIHCDMIKIVPLHTENEKENIGGNIPPNKQPVDPQIWYEIQGRNVLETLITDLNSRGHSSLTLHENGDICVVENTDEIPKEHLSSFPEKVYWPRLVQILESSGLAAEVTTQGIHVSW